MRLAPPRSNSHWEPSNGCTFTLTDNPTSINSFAFLAFHILSTPYSTTRFSFFSLPFFPPSPFSSLLTLKKRSSHPFVQTPLWASFIREIRSVCFDANASAGHEMHSSSTWRVVSLCRVNRPGSRARCTHVWPVFLTVFVVRGSLFRDRCYLARSHAKVPTKFPIWITNLSTYG